MKFVACPWISFWPLWLYFISKEICLHQRYRYLAVIFYIKYMLVHKYTPSFRRTTPNKCQNIQHKDKNPQNKMNTTITIINTPKYKYNNTYTLQSRTKTHIFLDLTFLFRACSFLYRIRVCNKYCWTLKNIAY